MVNLNYWLAEANNAAINTFTSIKHYLMFKGDKALFYHI